MRFETDGFERPTRSATSPSERPNSSISSAQRARLFDRGELLAGDVLDERRAGASRGRRPRGRSPGTVGSAGLAGGAPAALAGDQLVAARGRRRTTTGWITPCARTESASPCGRLGVEALARLPRVRVDRLDRELRELGRRRAADQDLEPAAQAAAGRPQERSTSSIATFQ